MPQLIIVSFEGHFVPLFRAFSMINKNSNLLAVVGLFTFDIEGIVKEETAKKAVGRLFKMLK